MIGERAWGIGVPCPACGARASRVYDTRAPRGQQYLRRRRECSCGMRFTTHEVLVEGRNPLPPAHELERALDAALGVG